MLDDPTGAIVCHVRPVKDLDGASPEAFRLLQCSVNGEPLATRRTVRVKSQTFTARLGPEVVAAGRPITLAYTYRTLVRQNGHMLHLDISHPTKGLHVEFAYGDCGIRYVNVLDYIAGARQPQISELPPTDPRPAVEISYDGWVFPKGGVAFVWVLEKELTHQPR